MLRSFAFLFARCPCVCVCVCLSSCETTTKQNKRRMKTWNMIKTKNKKNASNSQMVKNLKRKREKIKDLTRDPYFCPCDPDHVCQLSITFAWRVIHCWMEQLFFFFSRLFLFIILIRFIFRQFCLSIALFCFPLSLSLAFVLLHLTFRSPSPLAYRHSYGIATRLFQIIISQYISSTKYLMPVPGSTWAWIASPWISIGIVFFFLSQTFSRSWSRIQSKSFES